MLRGRERRRTSYGDILRTPFFFFFFFTENGSTICRLETEFEFRFRLLFRNFGFLVCSDIQCNVYLSLNTFFIAPMVLSFSLVIYVCMKCFLCPDAYHMLKFLFFLQFLYPNEEKFSNLKMVHEIHTTKINK